MSPAAAPAAPAMNLRRETPPIEGLFDGEAVFSYFSLSTWLATAAISNNPPSTTKDSPVT